MTAETVDLSQLTAEYKAKAAQYERKLATLTAMNSALESENEALRKAKGGAERAVDADAEEELADLQDEFARRLGQADKTIAELREERERLRAQLKVINQSGNATESRMHERDAMIAKLQGEGEALARKNGQLEATLRKARQQLQEAQAERDRAESRAKAAEAHCASVQEQTTAAADQAASQILALEAALAESRHTARRQVAEAHRDAAEATRQLQALQERVESNAAAQAQTHQTALLQQLSELQESLTAAERANADTEARLGAVIRDLHKQIAEVTRQKEEQEMALADSTQPLLKQIESMALSAAAAQEQAQAADASAHARCRAAEAAAAEAQDAERAATARAQASEGLLRAAKQAVADAVATSSDLAAKLESERRRLATLAAEKASLEERLAGTQAAMTRQLEDMQRSLRETEERLWESESRQRALILERDALQTELAHPQASHPRRGAPLGPKPANSTRGGGPGEGSVAASRQASSSGVADHAEDLDELFEGRDPVNLLALQSRPQSNGKEHSAVDQLRALLRKAEATHDELSQQLLQAYEEAARSKAQAATVPALEADVHALQQRLDLAMEVLGERNARVMQLEEDVEDMKRIFREQLEEAVRQLEAARRGNGLLKQDSSLL